MKVWFCALALGASVGCGDPRQGGGPQVLAGFSDSPWNIVLQGTVVLSGGAPLEPGIHRIEAWIESPGCAVHSVTVLVRQDGHWDLDLAAERPECAYAGTLTVQSALINGRNLRPAQAQHRWSAFGDPIELRFLD